MRSGCRAGTPLTYPGGVPASRGASACAQIGRIRPKKAHPELEIFYPPGQSYLVSAGFRARLLSPEKAPGARGWLPQGERPGAKLPENRRAEQPLGRRQTRRPSLLLAAVRPTQARSGESGPGGQGGLSTGRRTPRGSQSVSTEVADAHPGASRQTEIAGTPPRKK